ncbi:unnamed protein product, partial [Nesidiocoris tenuis]
MFVCLSPAWPHDAIATPGTELPDVRLHRDVDGRKFRRFVHRSDTDVVASGVSRFYDVETIFRHVSFASRFLIFP